MYPCRGERIEAPARGFLETLENVSNVPFVLNHEASFVVSKRKASVILPKVKNLTFEDLLGLVLAGVYDGNFAYVPYKGAIVIGPRDSLPRRAGTTLSKKTAARDYEAKSKAAQPVDVKKQEAWGLITETYEALLVERGEEERIWGSMVKQALKRRKPGFSEAHYGFRSFGQLLEEAEAHGILKLERDETSGGFIIKSSQEVEKPNPDA